MLGIPETAVLSRSVSADTPSTHRNSSSARGHAYLSSGGVAAAAARRSGAAASLLSSSAVRSNHANFLMMDIDSARQSVDAAADSAARGTFTSLAKGPQIPPDSTISAEDVIRESMASARSTAIYTDKDDFLMHGRGDSMAFSRSDSFAFSFSSRSTFRRSTISEQMLMETELFEPERELSVREVSEVLSATDEDTKSIEVTSIKEEEEDVKIENAKSRWAQHVKLKARNFLLATMAGKGTNGASAATPTTTTVTTSSNASSSSGTATTAATPSTAAQVWANKQKIILSQLHSNDNLSFASAAIGAAKLQKWNRWMHNQYQNNIGKVMQRAFKEEYLIGQSSAPPDPANLISIEEVVSNPRMMRYLAAWLLDVSDQSKLFFLCSFEEYRQFWCTLRANYQNQPAPAGHSVPFSKDDVLMLRTYGVKIAMKYLAKSAQFHIGTDLVDSDLLRSIKRDLATGGEDALRTFDRVATKVKRVLMEKFPEFRKTDLYLEMQKSVEREVICLEDILMNHRFANFFWIFLFPHNYHREIALWLDVEYEFKPAYRFYLSLLKTPGRRKEKKDQAAYQCRKLLKYISQKYYPGDSEMINLEKSLTTSCARLQHEQDNILAKFNLIHMELYHRFLTSRAYAEFSLYPSFSDSDDSIDDSMRLSSLLLSYGLRAHHWPDGSRESQKKRSLEVLHSARGFEAICGVLTFEATATNPSSSANGASGGDQRLGGVELRVVQHPLPHDPTPHPIDKSIENFLVPWCLDPQNVVLTASTCPPPMAFNFRMGDSSSSTELFAACVLIYKPAPVLSVKQFEKLRLDAQGGSRWVPYGVCIVSKFPLVDLLRERLAEAYEFILELETIESAREKLQKAGTLPKVNKEPFQLDKKVLSKIARAVSLENISLYHQPTSSSPSTSSSSAMPSPASSSLSVSTSAASNAMLATLPRLDHSVRILFDTLDISTVLMVFTAALFESRILFISSYLSVLMKAGESLRALMYPLLWPHVYLPVLPKRMLQYLECPTPFIFGVEKSSLDEMTMAELLSEDMLVVDLDKGCVLRGEIPCSLPETMLYNLRDALYECLKPNVSKSDHVFANHFPTKPLVFPEIGVRSLFYKMVQNLIGDFGYHRYVWTDEYSNKKMVFFDEASYLAASSPDKREFLTLFIATQAFSEFMVSYHGFEDQIGSTPFQATGASTI
uniref:UDENN domain-containing protein n=1 Tax=Globisporangium ultimum (strain ATCC 200006 / CBS 805.95 / DAOM BR144) TaxID=431595 RepID=K3WGR1_GLOUD